MQDRFQFLASQTVLYISPNLPKSATYRVDGGVDVAEVVGEVPQRLRDEDVGNLLAQDPVQHGQHAAVRNRGQVRSRNLTRV